jgi:transposase
MVLALVVNVEGFIKYSAIYEGNKADCQTLGDMIDKLTSATTTTPVTVNGQKRIVVMDAGIVTEGNLKMIVKKGYDYVCVHRSSLKKYSIADGTSPVTVFDNQSRPIELVEVQTQDASDREYYLKVSSPTKALKERSMYAQFCSRYEDGLKLIVKGVTTKGGVKKYDKVNQRIGRLAQKYPSVHQLYEIQVEKDQKNVCTSIRWTKKAQATIDKENGYGVYFLRTSIDAPNEKLVWTIYNCIREIESTFRSLKTDLDLRPIYHKTDDASQAHLHLGLLAYWIVNTIRHQLGGRGINSDWRELLRVMHTQKCVTTTMTNDKGQHLSVRRCSKPETKAAMIYDCLKLKHAPFIRKKSVVLKIEPEAPEKVVPLKDTG